MGAGRGGDGMSFGCLVIFDGKTVNGEWLVDTGDRY